MASLDAQADHGEQGGRMAQLEGHLQTVVFELQRLQTVVAQNAQDVLNAQNAQNAQINRSEGTRLNSSHVKRSRMPSSA